MNLIELIEKRIREIPAGRHTPTGWPLTLGQFLEAAVIREIATAAADEVLREMDREARHAELNVFE